MSQPPQVGQIVNGYQWNGTQWVPLPQIGQIVNGYRWDGTQWVPLPQVGQIVNGHRWDGTRWVPLAPQPSVPPPPPSAPAQTAAPGAPADPYGALLGQLHGFAQAWGLQLQQSRNQVTLSRVVAERKAFLSTARLEYIGKVTFDEARREVGFTELLKESGAGLSGGGDDDSMATGFGFQKTSYNTRKDTIADSIEEQAAALGQKYTHNFPYAEVRQQIQQIAQWCGLSFHYGAH